MSVWEECAAYADELMEEEDAAELAGDLAYHRRASFFHDRDGYMCEMAGHPKCLALGHVPDPVHGWSSDPDGHPLGWGGEAVCPATRYADACNECESDDCEYEPLDRDAFWAKFRSAA